METTVLSTEETKKLAQQLAQTLNGGDIVALYGDLGAGKTTFTRFLVEALGFDNRVQSPTFVISRKYQGKGNEKINKINHIDLYRLTSKEEAAELGLSEYFSEPTSVTLIEWPEILEETLPAKTIKMHFEVTGENERKILIKR